MSSNIDALIPNKPFFRVHEVAEILGLPPATVYTWTRPESGVLRASRPGGAVLIARPDLVALVEQEVA